MMTKADLSEILGSQMIRSTEHPAILELRPKAHAEVGARLGRLVNTLIAGYPKVFFCPHEPDEGESAGARYRSWDQVEANTWAIPKTATADEVTNDPAYPHGWTLYAGPAPLSESDWHRGPTDRIALLAELVRTGRATAIIVSDPDGTPWLVGVADPPAREELR